MRDWGCTEHTEENPSSCCDACHLMERIEELESQLDELRNTYAALENGTDGVVMRRALRAEKQLDEVRRLLNHADCPDEVFDPKRHGFDRD